MENNNEFVDSQTTEDTEELEDGVDEESTEESTEDSSTEDNELELKNKQLYERAKKAELKAKELEALLNASKKSKPKAEPKATVEKQDPIEFIKMAQTLKDYSTDEVDIISRQARALGVDLLEAIKDEDTQLLIEAKRNKIKKEETKPLPTNTQGGNDKSYADWTTADIKKLTSKPTPENIEELNKYNQWARTRQ